MKKEQKEQKQPKKTAAQRIDDLEHALMSLYQTADNMARDVTTLKDAVKILGNKVDAIVKATNRGETLTDEVISKIMVENNSEELKQKVANLVNAGALVPAEEILETSFIVGQEIDDEGIVQNPRIQFVVSTLQENIRKKFPGAKAGQVLDLQEGKWKFVVSEIYSIVVPKQEELAAPVDETPVPATPTAITDRAGVETPEIVPVAE
jgi:hypothetical protein